MRLYPELLNSVNLSSGDIAPHDRADRVFPHPVVRLYDCDQEYVFEGLILTVVLAKLRILTIQYKRSLL